MTDRHFHKMNVYHGFAYPKQVNIPTYQFKYENQFACDLYKKNKGGQEKEDRLKFLI